MLKRPLNIFFTIGIAFMSVVTSAQQSILPIDEHLQNLQPLEEISTDPMQILLEEEINSNPQWKKLIDSKRMSVGIVDLNDLENIHYAGINSEEMMYAASLPKIAILLASMDAIEKKCELEETPAVKKEI
ncbi:hypothetical protein ACFSO9_02670 [Mesonia maritima]|uniref:hypothetical protein n=1 Tax=Mesonia maritima TaxID=1793873 RepID=UPI0036417185